MSLAYQLRGAIFTAFVTASVAAGEPQFQYFKPSNTGIPGEEVRVMTFDHAGNLWVAGRWPFWFEGGLAMLSADQLPYEQLPGGGFDTGHWEVWSNVDHPLPSIFISDMEFDASDILWIASDAGLTRFDRHAATPQAMWQTFNTSNSPLIMNGVRSIDFDSQGNLWLTNASVNFSSGAVFRFNPATNQWTKFTVGQELPWEPPWFNVNSIHVGADDHVFVSHSVLSGLAEFDGTSWTLHAGGTQFDGMLQDFDGNVWITTAGSGLWKWNGASYQNWPTIFGTITVTGLGLGLDGTVYVSSWFGAVVKMINDTPQFFVNADNIPRSVIQRPNGEIWINNYGGNGTLGTVRHYTADGQLLERFNTYNTGMPDYFVDNIQTDSAGNMWFATGEGGLSRFDGQKWRNWGNHNDLAEPYPFAGNEPMDSMYEDEEGDIWMGGNGIARWNPPTGTFFDFWNWENSSVGVDSFIAIEQDVNGFTWIASKDTGMYKLVNNDWQQHLFGAPFTTANYVNDVARDTQGNLWVATLTMLHFFNGTTWFAIGEIHGSPVYQPSCVEAHPDGSVWIGALNGLFRYQNAQWTAYNETNSPMPTSEVKGLDIRDDGLIAFTVADFSQPTPWPNGVVLFDGREWDVFSYGTHPLPHYQLGDVEFDADGNLWVSAISEGVVKIILDDEPAVLGDLTGDGVVGPADLAQLLASWGACPPKGGCAADFNHDGAVGPADLAQLLANWG